MDFRILGPLEVRDDDRLLALGGTKQRALLAFLLLHANEVVSSDRLLDELWSEAPAGDAAKALQVAISRLRRVLEPTRSPGQASGLLMTRAPGYELRVEPGELDVRRFHEQAAAGRDALAAGDPALAADALIDALALWRGPPFADLAYEPFVQPAVRLLEDARLAAIEDRIAAQLALSRHAEVVAELEALVREHPHRERLLHQLMVALYRAGRQTDALERYREAHRVLADELGVQPGPELRELERAILAHDSALEAPQPPSPVRREGARSERLLERDEDLRTVAAAFEGAAAGTGRVVVVEGPAGIGKTTLLETAAAGTVVTLRARGAQLEQDYAWGVVRQLFERWLREHSDADRELLLRGAAAPARAALGHSGAADEQPFAAMHGLYWLATNAAESRPLALVVDDAHWCDDASLRWLAYLVARIGGTPLSLVLGVRRPDPGADREPLLRISDASGAHVVHPAPLSATATTRLVAGRLDLPEAEPLAAACHEATGGNPFLLGALLDDLAQPSAGGPPDPEAVRSLRPVAISRKVLLRIGTLPPYAQAVARAIAVLGGSATTARAAALTGLEPEVAGEGVQALAGAGIVEDVLPPVFVHPLVHAVILDDLSASERSAWHLRAATTLRESSAGTDEIAAQLMQVEPAGDSHVVATLVEAARAALSGGAPDAAAGLVARALREPPLRRDVADLERLRGRALLRARGAEGLDALRAAVAAAEAPGERAESALELGRALEGLSRNVEAVDVYERALAGLDATDEHHVRELEAGLATAAPQHLSTLPRGLAAIGAASERAARADPAGAIIRGALALATVAAGSADGVEMAEAALTEGHLIEAESSIATAMGIMPLLWGDRLDGALAAWNEVIARARERSEPLRLAFGLTFRGEVHRRAGRLADAEADLRAANEAPHDMWIASTVPIDLSALLDETLFDRGGPDAVTGVLEDMGPAHALSDYQGNNLLLMARGRIRLGGGRPEEAAADLLELGRRCESWMLRNPAAFPWRSHAALALRGTDPAAARELAAEEVELARAFGAPRALGIGLRADGLVRGGGEGLARLKEAVEVLAASPARLEHARATIDLGAALRRSGHREAARARLAEGLDGAMVCGAMALAKHARAELGLAGARPRRDRVTGRDALTASELRVARSAATGSSNREIAELLWVTVKTVETHLSRVYRKLGIKTRQELGDALSDAAPPDAAANGQGGDPDAARAARG